MPLDGISTKLLAQELNEKLQEARIDKVYQPDRFDIILVLRTKSENLRLILSANPAAPRAHLTTETRENPNDPPMFCMLLRKHLLGARVLSVESPGYERILVFKIQTSNELGDTLIKHLVIEMMGRHSNIILTNQENRIHDAIIHVDDSVSRLREIMPARVYSFPNNQDKLSPEKVLELIQENKSPIALAASGKSLDKALLESIQGFSPQLCRDVIDQAAIDPRQIASQISTAEQTRLISALSKRLNQIVQQAYTPSTYYLSTEDLIPIDFHSFKLESISFPRLEPSLSTAMDRFYGERNRQNRITQQRQALLKKVENEIDSTARKLQIHQQELAEGEKRDYYRQCGDLLIGQLHAITPNTEFVSLQNYFDPDLKSIEIPLQPHLSPNQNAQHYYKLYQKARGKFENNRLKVADDQQDLVWLESLKSTIELSRDEMDIQAIREEIAATGLTARERQFKDPNKDNDSDTISHPRDLQPGKPSARSKRHAKLNQQNKQQQKAKPKTANSKNPAPLPPRSFVSSDGILIQAGRNNLQNDKLTLRTAQKDDIWLHAQKIPGTHVVIRCGKQTVTAQTLLEAAQIAAWYSQSQAAPKVAVDYCPVHHVKKIAGARPGLVQYEHYQTLLVEPENPEIKLAKPDSISDSSNN